MDHEAVAGTGADEGGFLGARATWGHIRHLSDMSLMAGGLASEFAYLSPYVRRLNPLHGFLLFLRRTGRSMGTTELSVQN